MATSGYAPCACRDCFEIAIGDGGPALCTECEEAGCDVAGDSECQVPFTEVAGIPEEDVGFELTAKTVAERQHHICCGARITSAEIVNGGHGCLTVRR